MDAQIPASSNIWLTIIFYKGKGKSSTDPINYRAILLLPVVLKIVKTSV